MLRLALAARAYASGTVRIVDRDLRGFDHVVASRAGPFAAHPGEARLIAHGLFYGVTVVDGALYAFEACGDPRVRQARGRIVRLNLRDGWIEAAEVVVAGLDNGCHQMDAIGGHLYLADSYNQRIVRVALDGSVTELIHPLPTPQGRDGYVHVNSLLGFGGSFYLLLHNDSARSGLNSAIAVFDAEWRRIDTLTLAGRGCHNLALLEDGTLIACGSEAGEVIGSDGLTVKLGDQMTRGLSVGADQVLVGGSAMLARGQRDSAPGVVWFLDRDWRVLSRLPIPGPVMEIRRIDGRDRSLSAHLERLSRLNP